MSTDAPVSDEQAVNIDFSKGLGVKDILKPIGAELLKEAQKNFTQAVETIQDNKDKIGAALLITAGIVDTGATVFLATKNVPIDVTFAKNALLSAGAVSSTVFLGLGVRVMREAVRNETQTK